MFSAVRRALHRRLQANIIVYYACRLQKSKSRAAENKNNCVCVSWRIYKQVTPNGVSSCACPGRTRPLRILRSILMKLHQRIGVYVSGGVSINRSRLTVFRPAHILGEHGATDRDEHEVLGYYSMTGRRADCLRSKRKRRPGLRPRCCESAFALSSVESLKIRTRS